MTRGEIRPASRNVVRTWLGRFIDRSDVVFAVEGYTGWRLVVEELAAAGITPHLAEPADTATARGPKKRAKTDRTDARLLRELLCQRRLPESWIAPSHVLEVRTLARLFRVRRAAAPITRRVSASPTDASTDSGACGH